MPAQNIKMIDNLSQTKKLLSYQMDIGLYGRIKVTPMQQANSNHLDYVREKTQAGIKTDIYLWFINYDD